MPNSIRRAIVLLLAAALVAGLAALPAGAGADPVAIASKCKKMKKRAHGEKRKRCVSSRRSEVTLPGLPTKPTPTPPGGSGASAPTVSDLAVVDNPVLAGTGTQGQVTINSAAPSGGQPVSLQSSDPSRASVPSSVHVAAGATTASFAIASTAGPAVAPTITASIGSSSANAQLNIVENPSVTEVKLAYQCYPGIGLNVGGNRVTLDVPAPSATTVGLSSDDPTSLTVPSSVVVPSGSTTALFSVSTLLPSSGVPVTGTLGASTANDTASVRSTLSPAPVVTGLALQPTSVSSGGSSTGTVTLDCEALAGGSVVSLSSDNPEVTVPPTVTVPQDSPSATFTITATPNAVGQATITATLGGTQQQTLTINNLST